MALVPSNVDYTDLDFAALRARLIGLARSVWPDWTDFNQANAGVVLLELFAYVGDTLSFYQDARAREAYWPTLVERISAIRHGRGIGYSLAGARAASGAVTFSVPTAAAKNIPIVLGTRLATLEESPIAFRTTAAATLAVGTTNIAVAVEQAETKTEQFVSSGGVNQEIELEGAPYLEEDPAGAGPVISAADGAYTKVATLLDSGATDRHYVVLVDDRDRARVLFGNGTNGAIPQGTITVTYKIGGGARGNVGVGVVTSILDHIFDIDGGLVSGLAVTNPAAMSGGTDRTTVAQARVLGPASLRTLQRTVTKQDFEDGARLVAGVARALLATSNEDPAVAENEGVLVVVARGTKLASGRYGPAAPSQVLLDRVKTQVTATRPSLVTFRLSVLGATFRDVNVSTRVYLAQGQSATTVGTAIREALRDLFASELSDATVNPGVDFGVNLKNATGTATAEFAWSDVFNAVRDTAGVRRVDEGPSGLLLNSLRQSVVLGLREFPRLGTITVVNADTEAAL